MAASPDQKNWLENIARELNLEIDSVSWIKDEEFRTLFEREGKISNQADRLSAGAGQGMY